MRGRLRTMRARDVALFVVVAGVVAILGVIIGRAADSGGEVPAEITIETSQPARLAANTQEARPLAAQAQRKTENSMVLSISAPEHCDTDHGFQGWYVGETPVTWSVKGGQAPYQLTIDDETRDANHNYSGVSGTGSVSCALHKGTVRYDDLLQPPLRHLSDSYHVDSGTKTIRADVVDGNGLTATATIDIYIILSTHVSGHLLLRGHTYRLFGELLVTIPNDIDFRIGELSSGGTFSLIPEGYGNRAMLWLNRATHQESSRLTASVSNMDDAFDALIASIGQLPNTKTFDR